MLYKFDKLSSKLDELGYIKIIGNGLNKMRRDLTKEANAGNIEYRNDGIYLLLDGKEYKGYMYHKHPNISRFGLPKFHITNCQAVQDQKESGRFDDNYFWQNTPIVTLEDRITHQMHEDVELHLCNFCRNESEETYATTSGFFESIHEKMNEETMEYELDIYGYPISPINWYDISKHYRFVKNYTCEHQSCGIQITDALDKRFIHVHHKDGNKINCRIDNLECLCVLCHANVDEHHLENFQKERLKLEIKAFIQKYETQLKALGNIFLNR
ncbi:MAG: hypothetical protein JNK73_03355 [Bacteroidia bacterium]|nr:hypothetical protein [Bacteroidia bacterium]